LQENQNIMAASMTVAFDFDPMWLAGIVFLITYAVIMSEKVNRAIVAALAAGVLILSGVQTQQTAVAGVDFNTLGLLVGMMVIVAITRRSGVFQYLAIWSAKRVKANPWGILVMLMLVTAILSAFLDNVTTVLLIAPVTLLITEALDVKPYPYLFAEIFASNIGGTATLIGDPPNIMIGSATGLSFNDFLLNLTPVIILVFIATAIPLYFIWGRHLHAREENRALIMEYNEAEAITDRPLLHKALAVLVLVLAGFLLHHQLNLEPATIALVGAAVLLLLDNIWRSPEEQSVSVHATFGEVEWVTIFFFAGLFIVVNALERAGVLTLLAREMLGMTGGNFKVTAMVILWGSALMSAFVDNIPYVAAAIPLIKSMGPAFGGAAHLEPLWWSLSLGACLGGNGTLVGASANLVVAGLSERAGHPIRFMPFLTVAFPLMLVSIAVSSVYIWLVYL
jgi:Na+/H+ antiporter NhaD/arsenite permease-like protein